MADRLLLEDSLATDKFNRTVSGGWGTADLGGAYSVIKGAATPSVTDGVGRMLNSGGSANDTEISPTLTVQDSETLLRVRLDKVPTTGWALTRIMVRRQTSTGNPYYDAEFDFLSRVPAINIWNGTSSTKVSGTALGTYVAATWVNIRLLVTGTSPTTLKMKAWYDGGSEPGAWQVETTNSDAALQAAGAVVLRSYSASSNTNLPHQYDFDNLDVTPATAGTDAYLLEDGSGVLLDESSVAGAAVALAGLHEGMGERVLNASSKATVGVGTANANQLIVVRGILVVTATGSLELRLGTEVAASAARLMANSVLELTLVG